MNTRATKLPSRRRMLSGGAVAGVMTLMGAPALSAAPETPVHPEAVAQNVRSFGAAGDGVTDDTAAFQRALDGVSHAGGGTVYAPPGKYLFKGTLNIPEGVTLRGSYTCVPSHVGLRNPGAVKPGDDGTALLATAGKGREEGTPFLAEYQQLRRRSYHLLSRAGHRCRSSPLSVDRGDAG